MKKVFAKSLLVAAMFSVAGSALAVQKDITVTANVDAALDMTQTDNTALPKAVEMQYLPGQGLQSYQLMTKIWSNDVTKDVKMQLVSPAQLVQSLDASKIVPLTVTWGGEEIKADAATTFTATKIFASDALTNGSLAKNLMFAQTTKGVLETGIYRGVVSIYLPWRSKHLSVSGYLIRITELTHNKGGLALLYFNCFSICYGFQDCHG